jgi:hypothetical protein
MCECALAMAIDRRHFLTFATALVPIPEFTADKARRAAAVEAQIPWIDTHVHPLGRKSGGNVGGGGGPRRGATGRETSGDESSAVSNAAAAMDGSGITTMILLPPPQILSGLHAPRLKPTSTLVTRRTNRMASCRATLLALGNAIPANAASL